MENQGNVDQQMDMMVNRINSVLQAREQRRTASVQMEEETIWHRYDASTDGVTKDTPPTGAPTLHRRLLKSSGTHATMRRSRMLYQLPDLVLVTMIRTEFQW